MVTIIQNGTRVVRYSQNSMAVTRCICSMVTFRQLKQVAQENGITTVDELQRVRPFGLSCKLCLPYVRQMLKDGTTEFEHSIIE